MPHDQPGPMTLTLAGGPPDLQVVACTGQEALNEPWRFDIDLVSRDPHLNLTRLRGRPACFRPALQHPGLHGEVGAASQVHAGTCLSLYRLTLVPRLQRLAGPAHQRRLAPASVPQIITRLLEEHGLGQDDFRFEHLRGVYPPRAEGLQQQESDLHLLQRLCEEEGIHFRFAGRQLVFSDDPAGFPERPVALGFSAEIAGDGHIRHLAEELALRPLTVFAAPHGIHAPATGAGPTAWQRQRSIRHLERLRCEARHVTGWSQITDLLCGQVMPLTGHPEPRLNDHWLLTWIRHAGRQHRVLEGHDPHDIAIIARHLLAHAPADDAPDIEDGYYNRFGVVEWTLPWRPSLRHAVPEPSPDEAPADPAPGLRLWLDDTLLQPAPTPLSVAHGHTLRIEAPNGLTLAGANGTLTLSAQGIEVQAASGLSLAQHGDLNQPAAEPADPPEDLRLCLDGKVLGQCRWYIVRMPQPGLEHLSRLNPEHFLFEGCTDSHGKLGLSELQRRQVAAEYARDPHTLCLIHPGHCMLLGRYAEATGQWPWLAGDAPAADRPLWP